MSSDRVVVDVRHTDHDETVSCSAQAHDPRWAQYVVEWKLRTDGPRVKTWRAYLCRPCMTQLLTFADGIGVA